MADLPETTQKVQIEQTQFRGPVSESLMQTMGGAINYLLGRGLGAGVSQTFSASGTYTVPANVYLVHVLAVGGGGGGGESGGGRDNGGTFNSVFGNYGGTGGDTSFGVLVSALGGRGGVGGGRLVNATTHPLYVLAGHGQDSFGRGGTAQVSGTSGPGGAAAANTGGGGAGGQQGNISQHSSGGAGGQGGAIISRVVSVTPGQVISVTIGSGGAGGTGAAAPAAYPCQAGGNGGSGLLIVTTLA